LRAIPRFKLLTFFESDPSPVCGKVCTGTEAGMVEVVKSPVVCEKRKSRRKKKKKKEEKKNRV